MKTINETPVNCPICKKKLTASEWINNTSKSCKNKTDKDHYHFHTSYEIYNLKINEIKHQIINYFLSNTWQLWIFRTNKAKEDDLICEGTGKLSHLHVERILKLKAFS